MSLGGWIALVIYLAGVIFMVAICTTIIRRDRDVAWIVQFGFGPFLAFLLALMPVAWPIDLAMALLILASRSKK